MSGAGVDRKDTNRAGAPDGWRHTDGLSVIGYHRRLAKHGKRRVGDARLLVKAQSVRQRLLEAGYDAGDSVRPYLAWLEALPSVVRVGRDEFDLAIDWLYVHGKTDHPSGPIWRWEMYAEMMARERERAA